MNLDHLSIFIDLIETLNYRKTAERRHVSQPAVTQAINSLEREIGVKLFARSRSGVKVTPYGHIFYKDIKPLINSYYKALQHVQTMGIDKSKLTIGLTSTPYENQFIPRLLPQFRHQYPNIKIFLQNYDHNLLKKQLLDGECDLILDTSDDFSDLKEIRYDELLIGYFSAVIPKNNPLASKNKILPQDLNGQSIMLLDNNWCPPQQFDLQEKIREVNDDLDITYVNNVSTACLMCNSGLGISIMPNFIAGNQNPYVSIIPIDFQTELSYGIASLIGNHAENTRKFVEFMKATI